SFSRLGWATGKDAGRRDGPPGHYGINPRRPRNRPRKARRERTDAAATPARDGRQVGSLAGAPGLSRRVRLRIGLPPFIVAPRSSGAHPNRGWAVSPSGRSRSRETSGVPQAEVSRLRLQRAMPNGDLTCGPAHTVPPDRG